MRDHIKRKKLKIFNKKKSVRISISLCMRFLRRMRDLELFSRRGLGIVNLKKASWRLSKSCCMRSETP